MSRYGKIESGFWHNPKVRKMQERSRLLLLYLFSCPHASAAGCFVLPDGYIASDLGWPLETVSETLSELSRNGFIQRDETTALLRVMGWFGHNIIENANVAKHVAKEILALPNCEVRKALIGDLLSLESLHVTVRQTLLERLGQPFRNQEPNPTIPNPTQPNPDARALTLRQSIVKAFEDANSPNLPDTSRAELWLSQGYDPAIISATVRTLIAKKPSVSSLNYFDRAIKEAHETKRPAPVVAVEPDWPALAARYGKDQTWPAFAGPEPGMGGCRCPAELLEQNGTDAKTGLPKFLKRTA